MTTTNRTRWTATHTHFPRGGACKVYSTGRLSVLPATYVESGTDGWAFQYKGMFATETHTGYRTMAAAKAAAEAYVTKR